MKEDKALLPFKSSNTLVKYQYDRLKKIFLDVYISLKNDKIDFTKNIIYDNKQDISSPMVALNSIFDSIKNEKVFIITVDTPLISQKTIEKIVSSSQNFEITVAKTNKDKIHSLCGVFSKKLQPQVDQYIKQNIHKIGLLIKNHKTHIIECKNGAEFLNINKKEDYLKALKR